MSTHNNRWSKYLSYDSATGDLTWKPREASEFTTAGQCARWNTRHANTVAGTRNSKKDGTPTQVGVGLFGRIHRAHRIIWEMVHGEIPDGMLIDHRNGNAWDNRISNLRLCTYGQNKCNGRMHKNNRSGLKGVSWSSKMGKWHARVKVDRKDKHLGYFSTKEAAHAAYCIAAKAQYGEFARTT